MSEIINLLDAFALYAMTCKHTDKAFSEITHMQGHLHTLIEADERALTLAIKENTAKDAQIEALRAENKRLRSALTALMEFHPDDELGPVTEEYWTPEYKAAMDKAREALKGGEA